MAPPMNFGSTTAEQNIMAECDKRTEDAVSSLVAQLDPEAGKNLIETLTGLLHHTQEN